jgi:hypothetical protein
LNAFRNATDKGTLSQRNGDRGAGSARCLHDGEITASPVRPACSGYVSGRRQQQSESVQYRSFGEDCSRFEFVFAYVRGVEENGGLATGGVISRHGAPLPIHTSICR